MPGEYEVRDVGDYLYDLLAEKFVKLKTFKEEKWKDLSNIHITNSEFEILSKVNNHPTLISHVAKQAQFTRQATHKFIKQLEEKQLVKTKHVNLRDKSIELTELGKSCYEKHLALKKELEKIIAEEIGEKRLMMLKEILKMEWGLY